jgi:hypothetical protein
MKKPPLGATIRLPAGFVKVTNLLSLCAYRGRARGDLKIVFSRKWTWLWFRTS